MAYVAHDVYEKGINSEVFDTTKPVYIALVSSINRGANDENILKSILAVSELRAGNGTASDNTTGEQTGTPTIGNKIGSFSSKVLSLLSVPYNRTKSIEGDANFTYCDAQPSDAQGVSRVALGFAIIQFSGNAANLVAYEVDNGGSSNTQVKFKGPVITAATANQNKVLIVGNLTSNPTINKDSNFMFGGAQITFTEA